MNKMFKINLQLFGEQDWLDALLDGIEIPDDIKSKITEAGKDLKFVTKTRFNEVNEQNKELEKQLSARDTQIADLGKKVKDNEELSKNIADLQEENKRVKDEYDLKLKNLKVEAAINSKLTDTKYADLLSTKFDRTKIVVSEDGTVTGIDEQLTTIKETYKDLFTVEVKGKDPNNKGGGKTAISKEQFNKMSYKERVELYNSDKQLYDQLIE